MLVAAAVVLGALFTRVALRTEHDRPADRGDDAHRPLVGGADAEPDDSGAAATDARAPEPRPEDGPLQALAISAVLPRSRAQGFKGSFTIASRTIQSPTSEGAANRPVVDVHVPDAEIIDLDAPAPCPSWWNADGPCTAWRSARCPIMLVSDVLGDRATGPADVFVYANCGPGGPIYDVTLKKKDARWQASQVTLSRIVN